VVRRALCRDVRSVGDEMKRNLAFAALLLVPERALAHATGDVAGGLASGFLHPISGLDHVVAMVAVGLWGCQLRKAAIWILPVTFPIVMAFGGVLGVRGIPMPPVEIGIALSAIVLGAVVALAARPPLWVAAVIVGVFAVFHGYAHGVELPGSAAPLAYGAGFVLTTGMLHVCGITIGTIHRWPAGARVVRVCGAVVAAVGVYFLVATI
jgi:urease accessory protein